MKLTEGVIYDKNAMKLLGIVNMGDAAPQADRTKPGDHALVMIFQPFKNRWIQTIGAFLTRGAAKGKELAMLVLDAVTRLEQIGLKVDVIVSDGAPWNRTMWSEFGMLRNQNEKELEEGEDDFLAGLETEEEWEVTLDLDYLGDKEGNSQNEGSQKKSNSRSKSAPPKSRNEKRAPKQKAARSKSAGPAKQKSKAQIAREHRSNFVSAQHPLDSRRRLWFVSDFPHLIKSVKERILHKEILKV